MVDDAENHLLDIEYKLMCAIEVDPVLLEAVQQRKLTPDCFRHPGRRNKFRSLLAGPPGPSPMPGIGKSRAIGQALKLIAAASTRPAWEEPVREQPAQSFDPLPAPPIDKPKKRRPPSKEFLGKRKGWRLTDLKVVVSYSAEVLGKILTLKALQALFPNRDVYDPDDVTAADVGNALELTAERVFKFQALASAWAVANNYRKKVFWFRTIGACEAETEKLATERLKLRRQRVSDRRREERAKQRSKAMQSQTATATATATARPKTMADLIAEQKARTMAQCDAIYAVLDPDEFISVGALTDRVRSHSAWRTVPSAIIVRDIRTRLDMMTAAGRVENSATPGPSGSRLRLVRRAK
jgi:hypothetical protein